MPELPGYDPNLFSGNDINPIIAGTQTSLYDTPGLEAAWAKGQEALRGVPGGHITHHTGGRYARQAEWYRRLLRSAYGITEKGEKQQALDPLVRLQNALYEQYKQTPSKTFGTREEIAGLVKRQQESMNRLLLARQAAMGAEGLFEGAMSANERARKTLADQAYAAYQPMAYQLQKTYEQESQSLLNALARMQYETESAIESMGRK